MKISKHVYPALVALMLSAGAHATIVYDNGGPLAGGATIASDLDALITGGLYQEAADDFTLSAATDISGISWWGAYTPNDQAGAVPDDFTIRVLDSAFALIGEFNVGGVTRSDTGLDNFLDLDIYAYEAAFSPLSLAAGQYYLSIVNNTAGDAEGERWSWQGTDGVTGTVGVFRQSPGMPFADTTSGWTDGNIDYAFNVTAVPAPGALALLALGLLGFGMSRRTRSA